MNNKEVARELLRMAKRVNAIPMLVMDPDVKQRSPIVDKMRNKLDIPQGQKPFAASYMVYQDTGGDRDSNKYYYVAAWKLDDDDYVAGAANARIGYNPQVRLLKRGKWAAVKGAMQNKINSKLNPPSGKDQYELRRLKDMKSASVVARELLRMAKELTAHTASDATDEDKAWALKSVRSNLDTVINLVYALSPESGPNSPSQSLDHASRLLKDAVSEATLTDILPSKTKTQLLKIADGCKDLIKTYSDMGMTANDIAMTANRLSGVLAQQARKKGVR